MAMTAENFVVERKTERIELRTTPSARELIERAAACSGLTAGDLAYEGARRVLEDHQRMTLADEDRTVFIKALTNPPKPSPRLIAAMKRRAALG
jgi:uncharacterized protein (DUF1778 family)